MVEERQAAAPADERATDVVMLGRISGLYGVRGWVKIFSHTDPRENILNYSPWLLRTAQGWQTVRLGEGRVHGKGVVARIAGIDDRDVAATLVGADIAIHASQLETLPAGEYYWSQLVGLTVVTTTGVDLGRVDHLIETGANDVLVVQGERERLIPYLRPDVVREVDLAGGRLVVDWDPDF